MNRPFRADLHVHSKHSTRPSQWVLQKLGCPESFTEPERIYTLARKRGMDLVTISDHNTLNGSLEIAHLENTFISEEITTYFPEDRCKLHVLALNITEAHHREITRLRDNVYDLTEYLHREKILSICAHPLYAVNDRLTLDHFEKMLLLFKNFELNGARDDSLNQILTRILVGLTPQDIDLLADKHDLAPYGMVPWQKNLTGGSDDHSSLNIARAFTEVPGASTKDEFLRGIAQGKSLAKVRPSTPQTMAHNLYSIAYQFYKSRFSLDRYVQKDILLGFIDKALTTEEGSRSKRGVFVRLHSLLSGCRSFVPFTSRPRSVQDMLIDEGRKIIAAEDRFRKQNKIEGNLWNRENDWYYLVSTASEKVLTHCADSILESVSSAKLFDIFHTMGSTGSLYAMLAPFFVGFTQFTKDRQFSKECLVRFCPEEPRSVTRKLRIAHFTDTFFEVNGVATTLQMQIEAARNNNKQLTMITCGPRKEEPGVMNFEPIGTFALPEYPELTLYYPPLLKILSFCFDQSFSQIHSATPGPLGLCGLAAARILKLPVSGTYHTAFPQYVGELTQDTGLEDAMWKYMIWYYNQMDTVYVPSKATGEEIAARGIHREKIRLYPRGIDTDRFHPAKRNGFFSKRYTLPDTVTKLLYVGRISREKNLDVLTEAFKTLCTKRNELHLVMVGDGPYRGEMEQDLSGLPVTFTGYLEGEELAQAYSSSDIFLFPSTTDTFGNVVLEAQASGLPVIVSDRGGPMENLIPGRTGLVVQAGSAEKFAGAVLEMTTDPGKLESMKKEAREYMVHRSFEAAFLKTWDLFREPAPMDRAV